MDDVKRILFVCLGNICRSPAAEGVLRHVLRERGLAGRVEVASAGVIDTHAGELADPRMRRHALQRGYALTSRAQQIRREDLDRYDLIVAMDRDNLREINARATTETQRAKVKLLSDFLPADSPVDVPDPYYGGERGFVTVLEMIEAAADAIIDALLSPDAQRW